MVSDILPLGVRLGVAHMNERPEAGLEALFDVPLDVHLKDPHTRIASPEDTCSDISAASGVVGRTRIHKERVGASGKSSPLAGYLDNPRFSPGGPGQETVLREGETVHQLIAIRTVCPHVGLPREAGVLPVDRVINEFMGLQFKVGK